MTRQIWRGHQRSNPVKWWQQFLLLSSYYGGDFCMKKNESCRRFSPGEYFPESKGQGWLFSGGSGRDARMRRSKHSEIWVWTERSPFGYSVGYVETLRRWVFRFVSGRRWVYFQWAEELGNWYHAAFNRAIQQLSCSNGGFRLPLHLWYRTMQMHTGTRLPAILWPLWASLGLGRKPAYPDSIKQLRSLLIPCGLPRFLADRFLVRYSIQSG